MTITIPVLIAACTGTFIMGFGVAKGIYRDSKPFRDQSLVHIPTEDEMMDAYYESARGRE